MISLTQIERMIDHGSHSQLIRRVLANGRCTCPAIREHLLNPPNGPDTPVAACGLALQRCCELTYLPTDLAADLAERLSRSQMPDGRFAIADDTALSASSIALRGLIEYRDQLLATAARPEETARLERAIDRGLAAVTSMIDAAADNPQHATGIAIAVWQLGHLPSFRDRINVDHILLLLRRLDGIALDRQLMNYAVAQAA
jgi:hypothetical protein